MAILAAGTCNADLNCVAGVGTTTTAANKYTNVQEAMDFTSPPDHMAWFDIATQNDVWVELLRPYSQLSALALMSAFFDTAYSTTQPLFSFEISTAAPRTQTIKAGTAPR